MMLAGVQILENSVSHKAEAGENMEVDGRSSLSTPSMPSHSSKCPTPSQEPRGLSRVPNREPVDIQFSNITYTVSLGINKGEFYLIYTSNLYIMFKQCAVLIKIACKYLLRQFFEQT